MVKQIVEECDICKQAKVERVAYPGLLQPLPMPGGTWEAITMDFIEGLPRLEGRNAILVVVDRFTKYGHFIALTHPFTAQDIAQVFLDHFYKFHGLPAVIVTDRDRIFTSIFWKELFKKLGVRMLMSTTYHPQTDGQTERVNQCLETYLRCMTMQQPKQWFRWLSLAQWWYNSSHHSAVGMSPFQALYGYAPPQKEWLPEDPTPVAAVEEVLRRRRNMDHILKRQLETARNIMKQIADKKRTEREFKEGDWVFLKLQPYRQNSVAVRKNLKLNPRYYGPFQISKRIGMVAYELKLPEGSLIHPVFHVSLLKKKVGDATIVLGKLPVSDKEGRMRIMPVAILDRKLMKRGNGAATAVLVQWSNLFPEDATWEDLSDLQKQFPDCQAIFEA